MADRKAAALVLVLVVVAVFLTLAAPLLSRSVSNGQITKRFTKSSQAFWLAEAGIDRACKVLDDELLFKSTQNVYLYNQTNEGLTQNLGSYSVYVDYITPEQRKVTSYGYVPVEGGLIQRGIQRLLTSFEEELTEEEKIDLFGAAIYCAGDVDLNGDSYEVVGDIIYAGDLEASPSDSIDTNVVGEVINDPEINPLVMLNFEELYDIAASQGNVYSADRLKDVQSGKDSFPTTFWDGVDNDSDGFIDEEDEGVFNVVYIDTDLPMNGDVSIGGFIVVAGDIITDPDDTDDMVINGTGTVEGIIYTRGVFRVNGGGGDLNVNGGVLCGELGRLNGNTNIIYNEAYMDALLDYYRERTLTEFSVELSDWRETQNPYPLDPIIGGGES